MNAFLILVAAVIAGALSLRFYRKRGYRKGMCALGAGSAFVLVLAFGALAFGPQSEAPAGKPIATASSAKPCAKPPAGTIASDDPAPDGTPWCDGKWHDTPLGEAAAAARAKGK